MGMATVNLRLRARLMRVAQSADVVTYGELMRELGIDNRFLLAEELGTISDDCAQRGEPLLTAVGVGADTMTPAGGFFAKAAQHAGYSGSGDEGDQIRWWARCFAEVHQCWRTQSEPGRR